MWKQKPISIATELLNSRQERINAPLCSGIMLKNNDTSVEKVSNIQLINYFLICMTQKTLLIEHTSYMYNVGSSSRQTLLYHKKLLFKTATICFLQVKKSFNSTVINIVSTLQLTKNTHTHTAKYTQSIPQANSSIRNA